MKNTDLNPMPISSPEFGQKRIDEVKKASFWISQIFILLATVLGVYLASSQGFKQAMAYGNLQSARNNFYLRKSLRNEIADNITLVGEYIKRLETGGLPARKEPFSLDLFVWESMKNSSCTMETPPELLSEARKFYRGVADLQRKVSDNTYGVKVATDKLNELATHMQDDVIPRFDSNIKALETYLEQNGFAIE